MTSNQKKPTDDEIAVSKETARNAISKAVNAAMKKFYADTGHCIKRVEVEIFSHFSSEIDSRMEYLIGGVNLETVPPDADS